MEQKFILHQNGRNKGSYYRKDFLGDVLYYCFIYQDLHITFAKKGRKNTILNDSTADMLLKRGFITEDDYLSYKEKVCSQFSLETLKNFDEYSLEELYKFITDIREKLLGKATLNKLWHVLSEESAPLDLENCLNQSELIENTCQKKDTILVALTKAELFAEMRCVLQKRSFQNKKIVFVVSENGEKGLPSKKDLEMLLLESSIKTATLKNDALFSEDSIDPKNAALLIFGESGLLDARNLSVPCGIYCIPKGYHASAVAGQLGLSRAAAVYIPQGFSIVETVPITKRSRLNYLTLSKLARDHGEEIYSLPPGELFARFPKYFMNVYESDPHAKTENCLDPMIPKGTKSIGFKEFDRLRDEAIQKHLDSFPSCQYYTKLFTENDGIKGKILVHGVRIKKSDGAAVIPCGKTTPLRKKMRDIEQKGTGIVSNFLFFLTPKLATLYNNLRFDRPEEQAEVDTGHLDYLLEYRDGKRIETFPLFRKTCIALKDNGEFIFFNFRLGGGAVKINNALFSWKKEAIDPNETSPLPPVCIFTPYCSLADGDADRETYRKAVGKGRINFVLIQDRITAIRDGDVLLPGMGVVISLEKSIGEQLCRDLSIEKNANGYYDAAKINIDVQLNAPDGINPDEWERVRWAYGGGLSLILDGVGLCDDDHMDEWFKQDGWTSPLSRQTQESALHTLAKHPRTAIGTTKSGELVILVFSGRTEASDGADYGEMCTIARKLLPDIQYLMNVDGGGSAVLGMVQNGTFTELSLPSTSTGSTVGMVRPINTVLYIPLT